MAEKKEKPVDNMAVYNLMRKVPDTALKTIGAGRLKGMSDINPQFRIQKMTETFGMCGIGWKYEIVKQWNETYGNEVKSYCNINLYVRVNGEWSDAIPGTGGSSFVAQERNGAYVSDENFKMALTDALSVAMKALGMAADVYFQKGAILETKYEQDAYIAKANTAAAKEPTYTKESITAELAACSVMNDLLAIWNKYPSLQKESWFTGAMTARKDQILNNGKS